MLFQYEVEKPDFGKAVIVEPIEEQPNPGYRVVAQTKCIKCERWCWVGAETFKFLDDGEGIPLCPACGKEHCTPDRHIGKLPDE